MDTRPAKKFKLRYLFPLPLLMPKSYPLAKAFVSEKGTWITSMDFISFMGDFAPVFLIMPRLDFALHVNSSYARFTATLKNLRAFVRHLRFQPPCG